MLYDYQRDIVQRVNAAWSTVDAVMVQMPTGTGKTHVLAAIVGAHAHQGERIWIVAHRRELVAQIKATLAHHCPGTSGISVCSIQWLSRHLDELTAAPGLIVIDEAHHATAASYTELWHRYPKSRKLGMTATPCRLDGHGFTTLFGRLVCAAPTAEFVRCGRLALFDYVTVAEDSLEQLLTDSLKRRGPDGDFQIREMDAAFNHRPAIGRLYESLRRFAPGRKGIVYAINISHARRIADCYAAHGLRSAAIDSLTPAARRRDLVDSFRRGAIDVLINVDVFSEGFDCPDVEFVQLARPTRSLAKYLQQVGRGLRTAPGKTACLILDNVGLYRRFGLPTDPHDWDATFAGTGRGISNAAYSGAPQAGGQASHRVATGKPGDAARDFEVVITHERLARLLNDDRQPLEAFRSNERGRWGLRRGYRLMVPCRYAQVLDVRGRYALVKHVGGTLGIVSDSGEETALPADTARPRLLRHALLELTRNGRKVYLDLKCGYLYTSSPEYLNIDGVELFRCDLFYHSRTRRHYQVPFYVFQTATRRCPDGLQIDNVCLRPGDNDRFYPMA